MIAAVVLAAGQSKRMGRPKINLPWGETTVLGAILHALREGGIDYLIVVTGTISILGLDPTVESQIQFVPNLHAAETDMLVSLQVGIRAIKRDVDAVLVVLGDQPQLQSQTVSGLIAEYNREKNPIIIPSFKMRRGHPWLLSKQLWVDLLRQPSETTLRQFLESNQDCIHYLTVDTESILLDLDTPKDYQKFKPKGK